MSPPAPFFAFGVGVTQGDDPNIIFQDDFAGSSLNTAKWTPVIRISDQENGELNCCTSPNIVVSGGLLQGGSKHEDSTCGDLYIAPQLEHYTSFQIQQATAPFQYGIIETRQKIPGGTGLWPVFWMLGYLWQASQPYTANVEGADWPHGGWCEFDLFEFLNGERNAVNCVIHFNTPGGSVSCPLPYDATTRYMTYRVVWSATLVEWSVDPEDGSGFQVLRTITDPSKIPNVPMYLIYNCAIGGIGGGTPNPATFPQTYLVDWVRVRKLPS